MPHLLSKDVHFTLVTDKIWDSFLSGNLKKKKIHKGLPAALNKLKLMTKADYEMQTSSFQQW